LFIDANAEELSIEQTLERVRAFRPDVIMLKGVRNILAHELEVPGRYKQERPEVKVVLSCRGSVDNESHIFAKFPWLDGFARGELDAFAHDVVSGMSFDSIEGMSVPGKLSTTTRVVENLNEYPAPEMPALWHTGYKFSYYGVQSGYYMLTARGCPYQCTFCMVGGAVDRPFRYRRRSPENVLEELKRAKANHGLRDFYFYDEIFTMPGQTEKVCELMVRENLNLNWTCEGKPDLVRPEMLALMKRAGCVAIYFGVESGDEGILADVKKGHTSAHARQAVKMTQAAGILAGTYVTMGYPNETWQTYLNTVRFLMDAGPDMIRYGFLTPYPITTLHREMKEAGLIIDSLEGSDRRISPFHESEIPLKTHNLGPKALKMMDFLLKQAFSTELARTPIIAQNAG
jgi:anaerobic magnesium-protoporphyrin IX monomethyl ester cyclase